MGGEQFTMYVGALIALATLILALVAVTVAYGRKQGQTDTRQYHSEERIKELKTEVDGLRVAKHEHAQFITAHEANLATLTKSFDRLEIKMDKGFDDLRCAITEAIDRSNHDRDS